MDDSRVRKKPIEGKERVLYLIMYIVNGGGSQWQQNRHACVCAPGTHNIQLVSCLAKQS